MKQQWVLTAINTATVINKKTSKLFKFYILQFVFFSLKVVGTVFVETTVLVLIVFVGIVFIGTVFVPSIVLLHVITEPLLILSTYFLFWQVHVNEFQT